MRVLALLALLIGTASARAQGTHFHGPVDSATAPYFTCAGTTCIGLQTATVHLTSAQIIASGATPVTLVAAPGAGKMISVVSPLFLDYVFKTAAYSMLGNFSFVIGTPGYQSLPGNAGGASILEQTASTSTPVYLTPDSATAWQTGFTRAQANQPLTVSVSVGGPITTTTLNAGGTGYVANDTGTISGCGNGDATYKVLTVSSGHVVTYQITGAGTGYTPFTGCTTSTGGAQAGVGVNFLVNVTGVQEGDGDLYVTVFYNVMTLH